MVDGTILIGLRFRSFIYSIDMTILLAGKERCCLAGKFDLFSCRCDEAITIGEAHLTTSHSKTPWPIKMNFPAADGWDDPSNLRDIASDVRPS